MTTIITRFPAADDDAEIGSEIWKIIDGDWLACGPLSAFVATGDYDRVLALVAPADTRCIWSSLPDLEPRQAESVARLRAAEQSLGPVHSVARHIIDDAVLAATISPAAMDYGLARLQLHGLDPDVVIPAGLALDPHPEHVLQAEFDGMTVLRGRNFAIPDEAALRDILVGDTPVEPVEPAEMQDMLLAAATQPLLNLRGGIYAKNEATVWTTPTQRLWIKRLLGALAVTTVLLGIVIWAKHSIAANAENERALAAAQKIDPSIIDIAQAEAQLERALRQKGIASGRFVPLSAALWRAVQMSPNVTARELRYGEDGILTVTLAAPSADGINQALVAIQQDGFRITATPRRDGSGATLVDLTMRMP